MRACAGGAGWADRRAGLVRWPASPQPLVRSSRPKPQRGRRENRATTPCTPRISAAGADRRRGDEAGALGDGDLHGGPKFAALSPRHDTRTASAMRTCATTPCTPRIPAAGAGRRWGDDAGVVGDGDLLGGPRFAALSPRHDMRTASAMRTRATTPCTPRISASGAGRLWGAEAGALGDGDPRGEPRFAALSPRHDVRTASAMRTRATTPCTPRIPRCRANTAATPCCTLSRRA
jgi:hypothetical protein